MLDFWSIELAINMLSAEKKIAKEKLVEIIESAIKTAYKKDYWNREEEVNVKLDFPKSRLEITLEKTIVKDVENPHLEISFEELGKDAEGFSLGDVIEIDVTDDVMAKSSWEGFWRIASQAARQVIMQKIWDTEKEKIYDLFKGREWEIVNMKVDIVEWWKVIFDYNGNQVILTKWEQVSRDNYTAWARFYLYIAEVSNEQWSSPKVILSRKRPEIVPLLFSEHVPEIADGIVSIDRVVRQAGIKTKILVSSNHDEIDPVWTLIGQKWIRVKSVMEELSWEKIDIIADYWDIAEIIKKSLSPAQVVKVEVNEEDESSKAYIASWDRAKAVWKNGLNVNLASKLTWYKISIEELGWEEENDEQWIINS